MNDANVFAANGWIDGANMICNAKTNKNRVTTGPGKSWKTAKVMEGHGKVTENKHNVMAFMEFLELH